MRLWLDPLRLAARGLTAEDMVNALRAQNLSIAAGQIGKPPASQPRATRSACARRASHDPHQFENLVLKRGAGGSLIYCATWAAPSWGRRTTRRAPLRRTQRGRHRRVSATDANALQLESAIRAELQRLSPSFPPSLKYQIAFNPTTAVRESIHEVVVTLVEAIGLVVLVIFLFLQDWRATVIPAVTIPVSLVGTFVFVKAFGFSMNTLTMFGIVLATGLVVDDAIVVVENIARNLGETRGRRPRGRAAGRCARWRARWSPPRWC